MVLLPEANDKARADLYNPSTMIYSSVTTKTRMGFERIRARQDSHSRHLLLVGAALSMGVLLAACSSSSPGAVQTTVPTLPSTAVSLPGSGELGTVSIPSLPGSTRQAYVPPAPPAVAHTDTVEPLGTNVAIAPSRMGATSVQAISWYPHVKVNPAGGTPATGDVVDVVLMRICFSGTSAPDVVPDISNLVLSVMAKDQVNSSTPYQPGPDATPQISTVAADNGPMGQAALQPELPAIDGVPRLNGAGVGVGPGATKHPPCSVGYAFFVLPSAQPVRDIQYNGTPADMSLPDSADQVEWAVPGGVKPVGTPDATHAR